MWKKILALLASLVPLVMAIFKHQTSPAKKGERIREEFKKKLNNLDNDYAAERMADYKSSIMHPDRDKD